MNLLRRSLGPGFEDCKAAFASLRLATLRGAVTDILIADDQRFIRDMVRITLSTQGWTIAEAATADQTVDLAHRDPPRAVLLDVNFDEDGPTGFDVCKLLKEGPATKAIPVVMLTARDSSSDRKAGLAAGASHYLIKPFGPIDLINTLRGILGEPPAVQTLGQYLIDEGILTHEQLVLQNQLQELGVSQRVAFCLVQADVETVGQSGELEFLESFEQGIVHKESSKGVCW